MIPNDSYQELMRPFQKVISAARQASFGRRMRLLLALVVAIPAASCSDPPLSPAAERLLPAETIVPLLVAAEDTRIRLLPAVEAAIGPNAVLLGLGTAVAGLEEALATGRVAGVQTAVAGLRRALEAAGDADPASVADRDALSLLVSTVEAALVHARTTPQEEAR